MIHPLLRRKKDGCTQINICHILMKIGSEVLLLVISLKWKMSMTYHGGYHQRRLGPEWPSLRNLALTLTELPSGGYTEYLEPEFNKNDLVHQLQNK